MLYPHESFMRWMCCYGYTDRDVETTLQVYQIHYDNTTIYKDLDWLRADLVEVGGKKDMVPRMEGDPPRLRDGRLKPMSAKLRAKVLGTTVDLADTKNPMLLATMEALNQVRPLRRAVQLLLAKKVDPRDLVQHLERRFSMAVDPFVVDVYQQYFWPTDIDFADIYVWAKSLPLEDPDRTILLESSGRDLEHVFWQLSMDSPNRWDEGNFLRRAKWGVARQIQNNLDPDLNPSGIPPTHLIDCYAKLDNLEELFNERNTTGQADDLYELMSERMRMELPPRRSGLKTLDQVQGEVMREFVEDANAPPELDQGSDKATAPEVKEDEDQAPEP